MGYMILWVFGCLTTGFGSWAVEECEGLGWRDSKTVVEVAVQIAVRMQNL